MQQPITEKIAHMVDLLPEREQVLVFELISRLVPDDIATDDDLAAIAAAREDYRLGRTIKHEDIRWEE